jgi:lipopolysaccharide biosynthesis glycosyltransferase
MKNVVFMVNISESKKPGRTTPYEFSIKSWKHYCKRHNLSFMLLEERIVDETQMNANWHKLYALQLLESSEVEYDKVLIVDGDTIVHPDAPNIFDVCGDGFCAVHNDGSYDWLLRSMEIYSKFLFGGAMFPFWKYFNSGIIVVNKKHRELLNEILDFYHDNQDTIRHLQESYHVGTDQPVINFFVHGNQIDFQMLPYEWNMQDLTRREILGFDMLFTKFGWVYHFNAIPSDYKPDRNSNTTPVYQWMKYTYEKLYNNG